MYVPQNFFDERNAERLLAIGIRTKFAEYVEWKNSLTMIDKIKMALGFAAPPTHEDVEATCYYRYANVITGCKVIRVSMPYRQWMTGDTLLNALILKLDEELNGKFLRGMDVKDFRNKPNRHEFIMLGDPRTGKRLWKFEK